MTGKPLALIVEDDIDLSIIFAGALEAAGFDTEVIMDGKEAAQRLSTATPDVVVLDMHLPHVSGEELLERIHADDRLANTRVLVTTADARMAETLHDQADLVLVKPVSFSQLRDLAARLVPS
jgi:CheY-like chemotaxis protein